MKPAGHRETEPYWLYALAGALMLGGPVWRYLFVNRYPFDRPEAILLPLGAAMLGAAIAMAGRRIGGLLGSLSFGGLGYLFVDLQLNLENRFPTVAIAAACIVLAHIFRARRAVLVSLMLGAFNLASLPRPGVAFVSPSSSAAARPGSSPPLLVHIVLDEQWGIGGLRAAGDSVTAGFLTDFYAQRGFEVYAGAYSRWGRTRTSIPEAFSLGRPADVEPLPPNEKFPSGFRLRANPYFERLRELGYSIDVYQSSHLDFCHSGATALRRCETAPANSIANIGYLGGAWTGRAKIASRYFLNLTSHAYVRIKRPPDDTAWRRSTVGGGLAQFERIRDAIAAGQAGGSAVFVHVLSPHRPLEVDDQCATYADPSQRMGYEFPDPWTDSTWRAVLGKYVGQSRCTHRAVAEVLAAVDRTVGRDGAIVIVQGDHGWRVAPNPIETDSVRLDIENLNAMFSTLLAVRRPGVPPTVHLQPVPVQDFLWELLRNDFKGVVRNEWAHYIHPQANGPDSVPSPPPTTRSLTPGEMLWARPNQ